ncbi:MAG: helix-turn-helix transcriptional regulator [Bacteroidales bacterium]|nr:helix-turn-helix transcriptional regulator [Bacteroidales bacterium]
MLRLNCETVYKLRNISRPFYFLRNNGFTYSVAQKITNKNSEYLKMRDIHKLCKVLYCTPNDILEFVPNGEPEGHPLYDLVKKETKIEYDKTIRTLPVEELRELEDFLTELKKKAEGRRGL